MSSGDNPWARAGRQTKAFALATALNRGGVSAEAAKTMQASDWELAAQVAKTKIPSSETIALVLDFMGQMEMERL